MESCSRLRLDVLEISNPTAHDFDLLCFQSVGLPEWLSGMTRNHVGSACASSNPASQDLYYFLSSFHLVGMTRNGFRA